MQMCANCRGKEVQKGIFKFRPALNIILKNAQFSSTITIQYAITYHIMQVQQINNMFLQMQSNMGENSFAGHSRSINVQTCRKSAITIRPSDCTIYA